MDSAGLTPYFDKIILSDALGVNKPHPQIFDFALSEAQALRQEAIMIGDSLHADIEGASNSGIDQIWLNPQGEAYGQIKPTYVVKKLEEIASIL